MVADAVLVAFTDGFARDALATEFDAVCRTHIDHVVLAVQVFDHGVLTRDVRIFDREVARLFAAADDETVLVHDESFAAVIGEERDRAGNSTS